MSTPADIKSIARKINEAEGDLDNSERRFRQEIENLHQWWSGEASTSIVKGYSEIRKEINKLYSSIDDLESDLRKLASEVDRADDERKHKEEKKRLDK